MAFFVSVAGLLAVSCTDDRIDIDTPDDLGGCVTLHLSSVQTSSRAINGTEKDVNYENRLNDVWVFLFPTGALDDARPVLKQKIGVNYSHEVDGSNATTVTVRFNRDLIQDLFPEGNTAIAYVIANLPETTVIPDNATYGELKALPITGNFASDILPDSFVMDGYGEIKKEATSDAAQTRVTGDVHLKRSASKISLNVNVASEVEDAYGEKWTSRTDNMIVLIHNGVKNSQVQSTAFTPDPDIDYYSTELGNTERPARGFANNGDTDPEGFPFTVEKPFYSYPNSWGENSELMTYFTLIVQWQNGGAFRTCYYMVPVVSGQNYLTRNVSYRVNIKVNILGSTKPEEPLVLEDVSYRAVDWGSEAFDVQIDDFRYLVVDQNVFTMNNEGLLTIPFYSSHETVIKYELDTLNYYLYNTTAAGIEKTMAITNTQRNNSTTTSTAIPSYADVPGYQAQFGTTKNIYNDWIDNSIDPTTNTRTLYFQHELYQWNARSGNTNVSYGPYTSDANANSTLNNITNYQLPATLTAAYSRYRMTITIVHKDKIGQPDEAQYSEKFVIWQYPAMFIESQQNFYGGTSRTQRTPARGNMYVNGYQTQSANQVWYVAYGLGGDADNANPNQYVISVTQLSDKTYRIGDPRSKAINNLNTGNNGNVNWNGTAPANGWATAPGIENADTDNPTSTRKLSYYYPTDEATENQYLIAPSFRIASSYGVAFTMSKQDAQRRCASYQELQYPAGRWRLPTVGEIEYIMNLSSQDKIPALFTTGNNTYYWSAQGAVRAQLTNGKLTVMNNQTTAFVRCVYDEWYWGSSTIKTTKTQTYDGKTYPKYPFVWGDAEMKY